MSISLGSILFLLNHGDWSSLLKRLAVGDARLAVNGFGSIDSRRRFPGRVDVGDARLYAPLLPWDKEAFRPLGPEPWPLSLFCDGGLIGEFTSDASTYWESARLRGLRFAESASRTSFSSAVRGAKETG
jgi:hypothetical protein